MTMRRRAALVAVLALAACKPKHKPDPEPAPSVEPMPVAPPVATTPPAATFATTPADTKPGVPIPVAAFTTPATTGIGARGPLELRSNGTILFSGKEYAKFDGDKVVDLTGSTIVRVAPDGTLEGDVDPSGERFIGDELQRNADVKLSLGKDGNLISTVSGKKNVIAKVNGGQSAKRAVILVFVLRQREDNIQAKAQTAAVQAAMNEPCIPDPTKPPGNCVVTWTNTEPPPPPPPEPPGKRPKKR